MAIRTPGSRAAEDGEAEADEADEAGADDDGQGGQDEEYWRSTVLDLRPALRDAVDELRGAGRAGRRAAPPASTPRTTRTSGTATIKPAWDRTLDRIEETRREILDLTRELDDTLQAGREAGALPGWLREGERAGAGARASWTPSVWTLVPAVSTSRASRTRWSRR